ncbi:MAG: FecR domain-containing protein [Rhodospirillales bacterium]
MTHDDENPAHDAAMAEALDWFTRRQSGTMTSDEAEAFDAWHAAHPDNASAYDRVAGLWASPAFARAVETHAPAVPPVPRPARPRAALRPVLALAAALVLAVGLGHLLGGSPFQPPADHGTETGQRAEVPLPDGSVVVLNAESAVNVSFDAGRRRVDLVRGEAFFDVRPDPERPFEVTAGRSLTRVVGTAFSVTLQGGDAEVRVQRGHVRVTGDDGGAPVDLTPGEGVTVTAGHAGGPARAPQTAFAWLDGRFVFHDRPLAEVMNRLARHHKDRVVLATARLRTIRVSGNYRLDNPAAVVAALADVAGADVIRLPGLLTVLH